MNQEERIAEIEARFAELLSGFHEMRLLAEQEAVDQSMLLAAVLSLIQTAPNPKELGPVLRNCLGEVESLAVFQSQNEEQVEAAQSAQAELLIALTKSESRGS